MKFKSYIKRLKKEKFSPKFILSRIILRMNLTLPLKVRLDNEIEGKIYLHPSPFPHKLFIKKNCYKSDNLIVKKFVKEGDIVFDIGADLGALSILFSRLCRNGKVFAFEPTRRTFGFLLDNINLNGINNIFPVNAAVSNTNGIVGLVEYKYSHGFNYIDRLQTKDTVNVLSFRLDSFLDMFGLAKIDFFKN